MTGGYVYRGPSIPRIAGRYAVRRLLQRHDLDGAGRRRRHAPASRCGSPGSQSFGEGLRGELYAVSHEGTVYRFAR